jgi:hypothetical protein
MKKRRSQILAYSRYTSKLTRGRLMHVILPDEMTRDDFKILMDFVGLQEQSLDDDHPAPPKDASE